VVPPAGRELIHQGVDEQPDPSPIRLPRRGSPGPAGGASWSSTARSEDAGAWVVKRTDDVEAARFMLSPLTTAEVAVPRARLLPATRPPRLGKARPRR